MIMSKEYKTSYKIYTAWNYKEEITDLNNASKEGWQLIKGGCFHSKFKKNETIQYRYQLDYPGTIEDMNRYIETYREQGWEYVNSTFNGWHYFRKIYDPSLPEEEYEIFTDTASLKEMNRNWTKLASVLSVLFGLYTLSLLLLQIFYPTLPHLIHLAAYGFILVLFLRGILIMKNTEKKERIKGDSVFFLLCFIILVTGIIGSAYLTALRPSFNMVYRTDFTEPIPYHPEEGINLNAMDVRYKDNYYLDLTIAADAPIGFHIADSDHNLIYTVTGADVKQSDIKLSLEKDIYTIYLSDFAGGSVDIDIDFR